MKKKCEMSDSLFRYRHSKVLLVKKFTRFFVFFTIILLSASAYSQDTTSLTVNYNQTTIKEFMTDIENQTGLTFFYSDGVLDENTRITIKSEKISLQELLTNVGKQTGLSFTIIRDQILVKKREPSNQVLMKQQLSITGKVTDVNGVPLPGVTVVVKGTTNGTVTDVNGKYTINNVSKGATLQFSYVGMLSREIVVGDQTTIDITLIEDLTALDEVVVIGYGVQKKVTVTGAIANTSGDDLKAIPTSSVTNTLIGRLPGLIAKNGSGEPGYDDSNLLIRGNNTFGNNNPLVVVDGVADRAGGFARIDVNDIESITVLKDASAAIYGSRAANGVILVTTKRGKLGETKIDYTIDYGFRTPTMLPEMTDAADYATALNEIASLIDKNPIPVYTEEEIQMFRDGTDPLNYPNVDPIKEILKKYSNQIRHNLSVSGGSDILKYYTSLGYQFEDNLYKNSASNYKQYNLRTNLDLQANKDLRLFTNISLRQQDRNSPWRGAAAIWRDIVQGDPRRIITYPNGYRAAVTSGGYNPLSAVDGSMGDQKNNSTYGNVDLGFNWDFSSITEGLGLDGGLYFDKSNNFYKGFNKSWTLYTIDNSTGEYIPNSYGPTNAALNENMSHTVGITANIKLRYQRTFNDLHNISTFIAYEQYEQKYEYLYGSRNDFISTALDQLFAGDEKTMDNDGYATESARQNYFGRFDYAFAQKYLLQFNWRYDGSENFPKDNRFGFFPGASVGWIISEESFWKQTISFINHFKLRGSWGKVGNDLIVYNGNEQHYTYLTNYTFDYNAVLGGANPQAYTGIRQVQSGNPDVTWEVATTYDLGFDVKMFGSSVDIEFDVFKRDRDNILDQPNAVVPLYAGVSLPAKNVGSAETKGLEFSLDYYKRTSNFDFNIGGNFSYARSKIINFNEAEDTPEWQKQTGKPIGANWLMYEAIGIYRTDDDLEQYPGLGNAELGDLIFRDVNNDSILDGNDRVRLDKTGTPEIIFGINMGARYKNFYLTMLWQGASNLWTYAFYEGGSGGIGTFTQNYFDNRWTPENPDSEGPRIYDREKTSTAVLNTYFLKDATYLRLKNVELSYKIPKNVISKLPIDGLRVFFTGFNLLTITGLKNVDPESSASNQNYAGWYNIQNKIYSLGLNLTF